MGGKSKQSQRTKNNARPSSSGRSAELLINAANINPSVVNASGGNVLPTLFFNMATMDHGLNSEFSLCIKKLNKKDPITKTKALQELTELVNNSKVDDIVAALPSWAHFYKILTSDIDHKVRESAQVCQGAIMRVCGRRAAPQLKLLVPAWLQAQYDEYAPAAAAAQVALQYTFPNNKLMEVISFCKSEVISHLLENLIGNTENLLIKRIDVKEERDVQYSRIVASTLQGLEYFTGHLASKHDEWLWEELTPLLQNNNFWKLASHQSQQVRASWYAAVGRIIERFKETFGEKFGQKTTRIILFAGKEQSSLVATQQWTCLLLLMYNVKGWHMWVEKKDLLAKRILDILENGGWGDARHLTNMILPLLAHLPDDVISKQFYDSFFNAIFTGLQKKNVMSSKSERQSWITSLSECLRYLAVKEYEYVVEVTTSVHRTWLEIILSSNNDGPTRNNLIKHSSANMASLVKYWLKQSKEGNSERYDQLVRNFWQNIGLTLINQIQKLSTEQEEISNLVDGHILLLHMLKTSFSNDEKKQHSIKFEDEQSQTDEKKVVANECDESITNRYKHNLNEVTEKICCEYFDFANSKQMLNIVLSPLITLFTQFNSENLFSALVRHFDTNSMYDFYDKVLRNWLCNDKVQCEAVVNITFLMMEYLTEEEQDLTFESFEQFSLVVVEWCLSRATSHPHRGRAACRRWMRGTAAARALSAVCAHMLRTADCTDRNLLLRCVHGDMLITAETLCEIVEQFRSSLSVECSTVEHSARVAAQLVVALASAKAHAALAPLVYTMMELTMLLQRDDNRLPIETWREVRSAWQDGLAALPADERRAITTRGAHRMRQLMLDREDVNISEIEHLISLCPYLLSQFTDYTDPKDLKEIVIITKHLLDFGSLESDGTPIEFFALRYDCIIGNLNCPFDDDNEIINRVVKESSNKNPEELTKENFIAHVKKSIFRAMYLEKILLHNVTDEIEEHDHSKEDIGKGVCKQDNAWCNALLNVKYFEEEFLKMLHDYAVMSSLHANYGFWPHYGILHQSYMRIQAILNDILGHTFPEMKTKLLTRISEIAAAKGYYWSYAKRYLDLKTSGDNQDNGDKSKSELNFDIANLKEIVTGNDFFHTLQANTISSSDIETVLKAKYLLMLSSFYSCHSHEPQVVDVQFIADAVKCHYECNMDVIVNVYYRHNHVLLCERDVTSASWRAILSNAATLNFLTTWVKARGWDAPSHHWDFITIILCSLITSINKSKKAWGTTKVALLSRASMSLYSAVQEFISHVPAECERRMPSTHVAHLPTEWKDIFAPDLQQNLFAIHKYLHDVSLNTELTSNRAAFIGGVLEASRGMSWKNLPEALQTGEYSVEKVIRRACKVLRAPATHAHLYLSHQALLLVVGALVAEDSKKLQAWSESESRSSQPSFSLTYCGEALTHLQELVDAALTNLNAGEGTCEMVPFSDSHAVALAYLLLTDALLAATELATGELFIHYMQLVKEHHYTEYLITSTLRLLPAPVASYVLEHVNTFPADCLQMFQNNKQFRIKEPPSALDVGALSCRCLYRSLSGVGASRARTWRVTAPVSAARALTRLVRVAVAPGLMLAQLSELREHEDELENTKVSIGSNEVRCVYYDENSDRLELQVAFAKDHPLTAPRVDSQQADARLNVATAPHRFWLQNGRLLAGVRLWVRAISRFLDRAITCCICYCRVDTNARHTVCSQCSNIYHNTCLHKWFTMNVRCCCPVCMFPF